MDGGGGVATDVAVEAKISLPFDSGRATWEIVVLMLALVFAVDDLLLLDPRLGKIGKDALDDVFVRRVGSGVRR